MFCLAPSIAAHGQSITLILFARKSLASSSHVTYTIFSHVTHHQLKIPILAPKGILFSPVSSKGYLLTSVHGPDGLRTRCNPPAPDSSSLCMATYTGVRMGRIITHPRGSWSLGTLKHYNFNLTNRTSIRWGKSTLFQSGIAIQFICNLKQFKCLKGSKISKCHQRPFLPRGNRDQYAVCGAMLTKLPAKVYTLTGHPGHSCQSDGKSNQISSPASPSILRRFKEKDSCKANIRT